MRQPASQYDQYAAQDDRFGLVGEERDEGYGDAPAMRDRRLPAIALTLVVMALFAGGLWFAYDQGTRRAAPPAQSGDGVTLLRADERPTKMKPDQPGGMPIPDQNVSLYNDKPGKPAVEKLLPAAEQPMPRPAPPPPPPKQAAAPAAGPAEAPATALPQEMQPAAVRPPVKAPAEPRAAAPKPAVQHAATAVPAQAGKVQVRLGSVRTPEAAREEWFRLKRENSDLLGNLTANAVPVDLGEKGLYYRIVAGPLDQAAAERLCSALKRRNHGCLLAR